MILTLTLFCSYSVCYADDASTTTTPTSNATTQPTPPAPDASPLTGTFDITNNYVFRGISNSDNNPAVQGGLTYTFAKTGIFFNVWGSNVDFLAPDGSTATVEMDTIAGIANDITDDLSYNLTINRYNYPRASSANYNEGIGILTYKIFSATIGYSSDVYGVHKSGTYYNGAINFDIPPKYAVTLNDVSAMASVGHYNLPESAGLLSYTDYMLGLQKKFGAYLLIVQWTATNGESHQPPLDDKRIVGTLQVNF